MKFAIRSRWSGEVKFEAEIDADEDTPLGVRVGLAVRWARKRGAVLSGAVLSGADLRGAVLSGAVLSGADLRGADLSGADLRDAFLRGADLRDADLRGADLSGADLRDADLSGADLRGADLSGADLRDAKGISPEVCTPLLMLLDQPGKIRAYKLVTEDGMSPMQSIGRVKYEIGQTVAAEANTDPTAHCAAGINVATLDWCLREWQPGWRILVLEFEAEDIACIPTATDGKFRLHRADVVGEKVLDLVALGLVRPDAKEAA